MQRPIENVLLCLTSGQADVGWLTFIRAYSKTIRDVVRQFEGDTILADDCFEYVCAKLSDDNFRRLRTFEPDGPAQFRTWLTLVSANLCTDWRRKQYGRQRPPRLVQKLPDLERLVFQYLFRQGMTRHECLHCLQSRYPRLGYEDVQRISAKLHGLLNAKHRQSRARQKELVPVCDVDLGDDETSSRPDFQLQLEQDLQQLQKALARLEPDQRLLLQLRYQQNLTLKEIAELMGLEDPFRTRRAIDKALESLRKVFDL